VVLKIHDYGGLWSYKRGGLSLEVSLYCKSLVHVNYGLSKEVVSDGRGLSKEGLLYISLCVYVCMNMIVFLCFSIALPTGWTQS